MKILFLIRSLETGGAERQLVLTALGLAERGHSVTVITFYNGGFYEAELKHSAVQLRSLGKTGRWDLIGFYGRLIKQLRLESPDVLYSFLDSADVFAILCKPFLPHAKIVWGVRASNMDLSKFPWISRWSYKAECFLSRFTDRIIVNSQTGLQYAVLNGFPKAKMQVIHNGIDTQGFKPDTALRDSLRTEWSITNQQILIGLVGRIDPMKGHEVFLQAAKLVSAANSNARFLCVGEGGLVLTNHLKTLAAQLNIDSVLIWAGARSDMPAVYNALDILVSASLSEGFSNVIAEAMACGTPCVVTDVGDSAAIVGNCGQVVPPNNAQALVKAVLAQINIKGSRKIYRNRIESMFSLETALNKTEAELIDCLKQQNG